jgi:hypothetical protein
MGAAPIDMDKRRRNKTRDLANVQPFLLFRKNPTVFGVVPCFYLFPTFYSNEFERINKTNREEKQKQKREYLYKKKG